MKVPIEIAVAYSLMRKRAEESAKFDLVAWIRNKIKTKGTMEKEKNMSKLDRLTTLRDSLLDCCKESVKNADEWQTFHNMLAKVKDMISDEHRRLGYMAVYPIVNGSAQEALFEGTCDQCKIYIDILLEKDPSMRGNIITLNI